MGSFLQINVLKNRGLERREVLWLNWTSERAYDRIACDLLEYAPARRFWYEVVQLDNRLHMLHLLFGPYQ